jgi:hypothetical protein
MVVAAVVVLVLSFQKGKHLSLYNEPWPIRQQQHHKEPQHR